MNITLDILAVVDRGREPCDLDKRTVAPLAPTVARERTPHPARQIARDTHARAVERVAADKAVARMKTRLKRRELPSFLYREADLRTWDTHDVTVAHGRRDEAVGDLVERLAHGRGKPTVRHGLTPVRAAPRHPPTPVGTPDPAVS